MSPTVHGLHHVTAIAGDAQENLDFYVDALGLRLVKKSVNQDAPDTYHLFFADAAGTPGTDLTFFPWPAMEPGRAGIGLAMEVPFAIPAASLDWWLDRFARLGVAHDPPETRFGETAVPFRDPHGLHLALVAVDSPREVVPWSASPVPEVLQLRGMHAVRLWVRDRAPTERLLTELMGFTAAGDENGWYRYTVDGGGSGRILELRELPEERRGAWGTGAVHHVAWRVADTPEQMAVRAGIEAAGLRPTEQIDRFWFRSVYFKEPGGTLFELATDGPGFSRDEDSEHLGEQLILPPWLEPHRRGIEAALPPLFRPAG